MNYCRIIKSLYFYFLCFAVCINFATSFCYGNDKLDIKRSEIELKQSKAKKEIRKLKLLEKIETNRLYKNQQKLEYTQQNLQKNKKQYKSAQNELINLERKLEILLMENKKHQSYTSKRLVQIFKHKRNSYVEFLLNSNDINAFLDRLYFENIIIAYDKKRLVETRLCAKEILAVKARIETQKRNLESSIASINKQQVDIQDAISRNEKLIEKLKTDRATWEKAEKDLARQSRAISQMINQQVTKSGKDGVNVTVTSGFIRPVVGRITSPFGWRVHPIFKRRIFHSGLDIAVPYGTPIKAANSGRVIFTGWYSGYGKVVIIDHGKINGVPTTTLYAHMSTISAKQGANVVRGSVIGKVGTTGYSTGPHLHFEVRQKGNPVNPTNFVR